MKKQLLVAAVAATMSVGSFATISLKGDAHFRYANIDNDGSSNATGQRVRLHVTGKAGNTTVKLGLRNDGGTRVSGGVRNSEDGLKTGSGAGIKANDKDNLAIFATDYLYLTAKIGALTIKAGDWWDTTGLGVARKGKADADRIEFSTKVNGWKLGVETGADSSSTVLSAIGKIAGFTVKLEHNTAASLDGDALGIRTITVGGGTRTATVLDGISGLDAVHDGDYSDISIKGKIGALGLAAEYFAGNNDTWDSDANAFVVHTWAKLADITWHFAYAETDAGVSGITGSSNKFSPLGVSILANAPGVNGKIAIANFGDSEDTIYGVRADMKVAGLGVQAAVGKLTLDDKILDDTFYDIIVTKPLGKSSSLKTSYGSYEDIDSFGMKVSVKF